jgi:hypothetical protein
MPRGIKVKKTKSKTVSQDDMNLLNEMFSQMTGNTNADIKIIIPKYVKIIDNLSKYIKIYSLLLNFTDFTNSFPELTSNFNEIRLFIDNLVEINKQYNMTSDDFTNTTPDEINIQYKKLKLEKFIQMIIVTSGNLNKYKLNLEDKNNLKDDFIKRDPGLSLTPLKFSKLDLKMLWASPKLSGLAKKFILNILSHTLLIGIEMYNIINSPDVDIKEFSKILIDSIEKMKKQIPRCDKAFDIIANSVNLLENNFDSYYKNSIEAENPSIIIESFIVDVSMTQNASPAVTNQFKKIIMFMKRQTASSKDPRIAKLFKVLNSQFDMMSPNDNEPDTDSGEEGVDPDDSEPNNKDNSKSDLIETDVYDDEVDQCSENKENEKNEENEKNKENEENEEN